MSPSPFGRRASDRAAPVEGNAAPLGALLALVERLGPWLIPAAVYLVTQYSNLPARVASLEREQGAGRLRDSVSILDRTASAGALTIVGRDRCLDLGQRKGTERGYPCRDVLAGGAWPLLHALRTSSTSAASDAARAPVDVPQVPPTRRVLLAALLIPAATVPTR